MNESKNVYCVSEAIIESLGGEGGEHNISFKTRDISRQIAWKLFHLWNSYNDRYVTEDSSVNGSVKGKCFKSHGWIY